MSIKVSNITKLYGNQKALDDVSFNINAGEIVGFLGPNGAGKSTMMKIITCFIPQSSGDVSVCGYDVATQAIDVKKIVGYLPEHNPLYLEMYVKEYLEFLAGIYKIKNNVSSTINSLIDKVGLGPEQHKKIAQLSKGYRQRVGLAQALIHDPKVLILDEPTTGLDPNQIIDIRNLIKEIGKEKTVMLSTHIMQEVNAICDKIMIINNGQIVANDQTANINKNETYTQIVIVEFDKPIGKNIFKKIDGVTKIDEVNTNTYKIYSVGKLDIRKEIFDIAVQNKLSILQQQLEEQSLEETFQKLTSKK